MPTADPLISRLETMLTRLGPVEPRAMFGGHGLYLDGRHFAIVHRGHVYFRVDAATTAAFAAGKTLLPWARRAIAAARRYGANKTRRIRKPNA
jgi:DNA transformation protein